MSDAGDRHAVRDAVLSFAQPSERAREHRRLMDEGRRPIDWTRSTVDTLPTEIRDELASLWRARMTAEHRSIGLFALYTLDLLGVGAPADVLSLATRASLDEVRHTELFGRLAAVYSGHDEHPPPGIPPMPDEPDLPLAHQVAREALYLSACAETYSMVSLGAQRARATDPVVRDVYAVVLGDEVHHARMGWSLLGSMLATRDDALRAFLQSQLGPMFDYFVATLFGDPASLAPSPWSEAQRRLAEGHGLLERADEWAFFRATLTDVWVPGFAALGLDARDVAARYAPR